MERGKKKDMRDREQEGQKDRQRERKDKREEMKKKMDRKTGGVREERVVEREK